MSDRYLEFANSPLGKSIATALGLPAAPRLNVSHALRAQQAVQPMALARMQQAVPMAEKPAPARRANLRNHAVFVRMRISPRRVRVVLPPSVKRALARP